MTISCGVPVAGSRVGLRRIGLGELGLPRVRGGVLMAAPGAPADPAGPSELGRDAALGSRPCSEAPPGPELA
eukprot:10940741-Prorocentrum_lima.AAC.1